MIAMVLVSILGFSSCSNKVFPISKLEENYAERMTSNSDLNVRANVRIFYKETDIKGDFEVLSINRYTPWFAIPIFYSSDKQIKIKFLENAARTAYKQGANAILIVAPKYYKALKLSDFKNNQPSFMDSGKGDGVKTTWMGDPIGDMTLANKFANGDMNNVKKRILKRTMEAFEDELDDNLKAAKSLDQLDYIRNKVDIYEEWNNGRVEKDDDVTQTIADYRKKISSKEQSIKKKMERKANKRKK